MPSTPYRRRVQAALRELGIAPASIEARRLPLQNEAQRLVPVGLGTDGRDKLLAPKAAQSWLKMREAARRDGVELLLISGFRSLEFQATLIRNKLARGMSLDEVLKVNAPPGYSEHHTGQAVDIGCRDSEALDEAFETTPAFDWLRRRAGRFGFTLSYPRGNRDGFLYEPWHWRCR